MSAPTTLDMAGVARELRDALAEHDRVCLELGGNRATGEVGVAAAYKKAYLAAHAASTTFHPERKVKEHEIAAEEASYKEWAELNAVEYELKALKEKMHSLRQVLSAWQTQARTEREDR